MKLNSCCALPVYPVLKDHSHIKMSENIFKHSRTSPDVQSQEISFTKQKTRRWPDYDELAKPVLKNQIKTENRCQNAACEQKTTNKKANFFQTAFSHCTLKLERKNFTPQNRNTRFSLHFLFRHGQNHCSNLTSKIIKMCEEILRQRPNTIQIIWIVKKKQSTNTIQILWIVKNHDVPNNSRYRFAAINKVSTYQE